jgi:nucleotide-binding universal stress UspA family protein
MLKSLLIGLDGSDDCRLVLELGLRWAKRFDALAVGIGVVDEPGLFNSGRAPFGGSHHRHPTAPIHLLYGARHRVDQILEEFTWRCVEEGVKSTTLEDVGSPYVQILMEAQCYDLVLLGRQTHFDYGTQGEPDETLGKVVQDSPRPVVAVPKSPCGGETIVVAYDGSLQAARVLSSFESSGLARGREIQVVSIADSKNEASRRADRAVEFLTSHGLNAISCPLHSASPPAELLLEMIKRYDAGLLVMGAYGQPILREFFLGSTTRTILATCPVPSFLYH